MTDKKALMVIAQDLFRDEEYDIPKQVLESAGIKVTTASRQIGRAKGKLGMVVQVDAAINTIKASDYDAVIFVGGPGSYGYHEDAQAHRIVKETLESEKILGGICAAAGILAYAGVLKGKKATSFSGVSEILKEKGAQYTASGVEIDGNIITADGPEHAKRFGEEIVKAINAKQ